MTTRPPNESAQFVTTPRIWVHDEEYFQSQDHMAFYPGTKEQFTIENALLLMVIMKLLKTPEGVKTLERLTIKYMEVTTRIVEASAEAAKHNWDNGINAAELNAAICHKLGLIDDGGYIRILNSVRNRFDKLYVMEGAGMALGGVTTLIEGSKTTEGKEGGGAQGLASLAVMLKPLLAAL